MENFYWVSSIQQIRKESIFPRLNVVGEERTFLLINNRIYQRIKKTHFCKMANFSLCLKRKREKKRQK